MCVNRLSPVGAALVLVLSLLLVVPAMAQEWEQVYTSDSLRVSKRDYQGSALDEIKGVVRVKASLNAVMALLKDAPFNRQWVYRSGGARILAEPGYAQAYVYGVVDAPLPMSDRDTVVRFDYQQDPQSKVITVTITNVPEYIATHSGLVRVPEMGGFWRLEPEADGWVEVTYQIYGDPGGWIPAWLANRAAVLSVRHTLSNLVEVVGRYANARSEFVAEPG
jgi:hypothetical protein